MAALADLPAARPHQQCHPAHADLFGQTEIGAGLAAILNATTPMWTMLIANRFTADEKLSPAKLAGTLLGLAGTAVLIGPSALQVSDVPLWAVLLPVVAAISYGCAATYGKSFRDLPAPVTATGQLTASSLIMLPTALLVDHPWQIPFPARSRRCDPGAGSDLNCLRLYPVFPHHGAGRGDQRILGDTPRSGQARSCSARSFGETLQVQDYAWNAVDRHCPAGARRTPAGLSPQCSISAA